MAFDAPSLEILAKLGLALGLGAIIGLERERHRKERDVLAGVRTYPLISLSGLAAAELANRFEEGLLISVGAFVAGSFAIMMYWVRQRLGHVGLTSPIALYVTYFVGVLTGLGRTGEAIVAGLAIALLLFTKERLHHFAEVMTPQELEGALYFLVLALILYPILPADPVDPWNALRLQNVLLIILLVSIISFLSFLILRRWGGTYGLPFSGALGGLVNSEATTVSLAAVAAKRKTLHNAAYVGVLLCTGTLFVRNLAIAVIADPSLAFARELALPLLWGTLTYVLWAVPSLRAASPTETDLRLESPFAFRPAFKFAFWFAFVSFLVVLLGRMPGVGNAGYYIAALGGLVSAGAVTASMGALVAHGTAPPDVAVQSALLASLVSAANKPIFARFAGAPFAGRLWAPTILGILVAGGVFGLLQLLP